MPLIPTPHPTNSPLHGRLSLTPPPPPSDWYKYPQPKKKHQAKDIPLTPFSGARTHRQESKMVGEWRVGELIGKGSSGKVRLARNVTSGEWGAVKMIKKKKRDSKNPTSTDREIIIMKLVEHSCIVKLLDVYETPTHLFLISEYCPLGELYFHISAHRLSLAHTRSLFSQLVSALSHLHLLNISHRDIKFENLLLYRGTGGEDGKEGELRIKLADLGMSGFQRSEGELLMTSCGSPHYCAPEVVLGKPYDGPPTDIWSAGVVLFAMLARELPFDHENVPTLLGMIKRGEYKMSEKIKGDAKDLVEAMLQVDVKERLNIQQVAQHPFLTSQPHRNSTSSTSTGESSSSSNLDLTPQLPEWNLPYPISLGGLAMPSELEAFDNSIVTSLMILLKESDAEKVEECIKGTDGELNQIQLFYAILKNFRTRDQECPTIPSSPCSSTSDSKTSSPRYAITAPTTPPPNSANPPAPPRTYTQRSTKSLPPPTPPPNSPLPPTPMSSGVREDMPARPQRRAKEVDSGPKKQDSAPLPSISVMRPTSTSAGSHQSGGITFPSETDRTERRSWGRSSSSSTPSPREKRFSISRKLKKLLGDSPPTPSTTSSCSNTNSSSPSPNPRSFKRSSGYYSLRKVIGFSPPLPTTLPSPVNTSTSNESSGLRRSSSSFDFESRVCSMESPVRRVDASHNRRRYHSTMGTMTIRASGGAMKENVMLKGSKMKEETVWNGKGKENVSPSPSPNKKRPAPLTLKDSNIPPTPPFPLSPNPRTLSPPLKKEQSDFSTSSPSHNSALHSPGVVHYRNSLLSPSPLTPSGGASSSYASLKAHHPSYSSLRQAHTVYSPGVETPSTAGDPFGLLEDLEKSDGSSAGNATGRRRTDSRTQGLSHLSPRTAFNSPSPTRSPSPSPALDRSRSLSPTPSISRTPSPTPSQYFNTINLLRSENQVLRTTLLLREEEITRLEAGRKRLSDWVAIKEELYERLEKEKDTWEQRCKQLEEALESISGIRMEREEGPEESRRFMDE